MVQQDKRGRLPRDPAFKRICSHPRMIADALRGYAAKPGGPLDPRTVAALDFRTLRKLPTEWAREDFRLRLSDQVWRVRFRRARYRSDPASHLLILVEFQSQPHPDMALRMAGYAVRIHEELEAAGVVRGGGLRPPIFPMVIHNGPGRWTAPTTLSGLIAKPALPLAAAARTKDIGDARYVADDLAAFQLSHAYFTLDFHRHRADDPSSDNAMSLLIGLESAFTPEELLPLLRVLRGLTPRRLAGTMLEWTLRRLGVDVETAEEMRRMASLDEFHSQLEERARGWTEQWFAEGVEHGIEQGVERGRAEGVAAQREGLRRQAALRFGASARLLDAHLESVESSAKLTEIGEWLVVDTLDELIAKIEATATDGRID